MKDDKEKLHVFDSSGLYTEIIPQTDKAQKPEKIIHKEPTCLFVKKQESGIIKRIHILEIEQLSGELNFLLDNQR